VCCLPYLHGPSSPSPSEYEDADSGRAESHFPTYARPSHADGGLPCHLCAMHHPLSLYGQQKRPGGNHGSEFQLPTIAFYGR